jgi:hypothetical protein
LKSAEIDAYIIESVRVTTYMSWSKKTCPGQCEKAVSNIILNVASIVCSNYKLQRANL